MKKMLMCFCSLVMAVPLISWAADQHKPPPSRWAGSKVALGYSGATGNKPSSALNSQADIDYAVRRWTESFVAAYQYGSSDKVVNKKQMLLQDQLQYSFNDNADVDNYVYVKGSLQTNKFTAYQSTTLGSIGYGRDWIKKKNFSFTSQFGPAVRWLKTQNPEAVLSRNAVLQMTVASKWTVSNTLTLGEEVNYTIGHPANHLVSTSSITNTVTANIALSANFIFEHWSTIPEGSDLMKKNNATTTINMVYTL